jgi:hypothetical protein
MATYTGTRGAKRVVVTVNGTPLPERQDLVNHSPEGFEWGYAGSGPSQLALAILAHHFHSAGDEHELADAKALALYHDFKLKLVAKLPKEGWRLSTHVVADTVNMLVKEEAERTFVHAMWLEMENRRLSKDLSECYELLEQLEAEKE